MCIKNVNSSNQKLTCVFGTVASVALTLAVVGVAAGIFGLLAHHGHSLLPLQNLNQLPIAALGSIEGASGLVMIGTITWLVRKHLGKQEGALPVEEPWIVEGPPPVCTWVTGGSSPALIGMTRYVEHTGNPPSLVPTGELMAMGIVPLKGTFDEGITKPDGVNWVALSGVEGSDMSIAIHYSQPRTVCPSADAALAEILCWELGSYTMTELKIRVLQLLSFDVAHNVLDQAKHHLQAQLEAVVDTTTHYKLLGMNVEELDLEETDAPARYKRGMIVGVDVENERRLGFYVSFSWGTGGPDTHKICIGKCEDGRFQNVSVYERSDIHVYTLESLNAAVAREGSDRECPFDLKKKRIQPPENRRCDLEEIIALFDQYPIHAPVSSEETHLLTAPFPIVWGATGVLNIRDGPGASEWAFDGTLILGEDIDVAFTNRQGRDALQNWFDAHGVDGVTLFPMDMATT